MSSPGASTSKTPIDDRFNFDAEDEEFLNDEENSGEEDELSGSENLEEEYGGTIEDDDEANLLSGGMAPLSAAALAKFEAAQARSGIVYISRIPPAMRPSKVRHLMSGFGEIGRVYLQQEDPKRAHLRRKHTSTKKAHFTEGWVEFVDKRVGRAVAEMLNGQPIGGKKGTRFREDVWTMKYLPRFKWNQLSEHIAHEVATRTARLRVELSQSKNEQKEYLKNVELARVLKKREERKKTQGVSPDTVAPSSVVPAISKEVTSSTKKRRDDDGGREKKRRRKERPQGPSNKDAINDVLASIF